MTRSRIWAFPFQPVAMLLALLAIASACMSAPDRITAVTAIVAILAFMLALRLFLRMAEDDWRRQAAYRLSRRVRGL